MRPTGAVHAALAYCGTVPRSHSRAVAKPDFCVTILEVPG